MQILDYKCIAGTELRERYVAIPELHRTKPAAAQFIRLAELDIKLSKPAAFLFIDGFSMSPSETNYTTSEARYTPVIKTGAAMVAHQWIHTFEGKEWLKHVDVLSGTCAAGIQAMYRAQLLLNSGIQDVIVIGSERTTADTMRLFKELHIPVTCGDGFIYMRLGYEDGKPDVGSITWKFVYNQNPFEFTREQLDMLIPTQPMDYVKLHDTGTEINTVAEAGLAAIAKPISYKSKIGHTQGISALLETGLVLDDDSIMGKILVTANGLGGYHGAFTLTKYV